jgi:acyl-CoA synthetase (AMP-forming)/AMP-acid ligase II
MHVLKQIHDTAAASPDKLAVVYNGQPIAFARFWRLIDACRRDLAVRNLRRGLVLVNVANLLDGWVLNLALRSLGFDTAATGSGPVEGYDVSAVITVRSEAESETPAPHGAARLDLPPPSAAHLADDAPLPPWDLEGPYGAHVLLTSGTTGRPKAVPSRAGETAEAFAATRQINRALDQRFESQGAAAIFCMFNLGLWTAAGYTLPVLAWTQGAAVVLDQRGEHHLALQWPGITRATVTPYYLTHILRAPEGAFPYQPQLRLVLWAGAITAPMLAEARRRITPMILNNLASTEVGLWASTALDSDDDLTWHRLVPTQRVEVVDDAGRPLPPGRLGEVRIALASAGSASHLGDAATTAAQYQDGWFYPGDLGVFDDRGRLSLRGRASDVVNIDGNKIVVEPWERKLREELGCEAVCILAGHFGGARDTMHVFIEASAPIALERLTRSVQSTLYGYPSVQAHLATLPRTPMGKIRRLDLAQQLNDGLFATAPAA